MKTTLVRCPLADVVRLYCCFHQAGASLDRGYGRQHEVRSYIEARSKHYNLPSFLIGPWSAIPFRADDSENAVDFFHNRPLKEKIKLYVFCGVVGLINRFRRKTVLLDTRFLSYVYGNFQHMQAFLDSDTEDFPDAPTLRYHLYGSFGWISLCAGTNHFAKAQDIERFNRAPIDPTYTFEEILAHV